MKKTIIALLVLATTVTAKAQSDKNLSINVGAEIGSATGNLNDAYSLAIGATLQADIKIDEDAAITFNAGLIEYLGRKVGGTNLKIRSQAFIPLLAGVKYYFDDKLYGAAQLGVTVLAGNNNNNGSLFTFAPGVGYKFDERIDAQLKYTGYSSKNANSGGAFGFRIAYTL